MIADKIRGPGSIYDVARKAGVSIGTVSRVFNDKQDVSASTRLKVLKAAKVVRYLPKISARRISVGVVVQDIGQANEVGFVSNAVSTLSKHLASRGAVLELLPLDDMDGAYRKYLRGLIAIVFGSTAGPLAAIRDLPVVLLNNRFDAPNFQTVGSDHAQGSRTAVRHLLERGHRRIGFLEVQSGNWGARERERGYREAFESAGARPPADLIRYLEHRPVREVLEPLMKAKPTALLVCGEDLSLAANRCLLHELKVKIPRDLSLVTYETPLVSELLSPPQTTVAQPWEDIGRCAVDSLLERIRNPARKAVDILLANTLIERQSVRAAS